VLSTAFPRSTHFLKIARLGTPSDLNHHSRRSDTVCTFTHYHLHDYTIRSHLHWLEDYSLEPTSPANIDVYEIDSVRWPFPGHFVSWRPSALRPSRLCPTSIIWTLIYLAMMSEVRMSLGMSLRKITRSRYGRRTQAQIIHSWMLPHQTTFPPNAEA
jgi:hypothetical protein